MSQEWIIEMSMVTSQ